MPYYQKLYHMIFNAATDALEALENGEERYAAALLANAQHRCEEEYLRAADELSAQPH